MIHTASLACLAQTPLLLLDDEQDSARASAQEIGLANHELRAGASFGHFPNLCFHQHKP